MDISTRHTEVSRKDDPKNSAEYDQQFFDAIGLHPATKKDLTCSPYTWQSLNRGNLCLASQWEKTIPALMRVLREYGNVALVDNKIVGVFILNNDHLISFM